jgi:hypothetical protein
MLAANANGPESKTATTTSVNTRDMFLTLLTTATGS